jgi:hypothetical protein
MASGLDYVPKQAFVPKRCALGTRRLIAPAFSGAGITKSHGKDRNSRCIVEDRAVQLQPVTQAIAACIIPRYPGLMNFAPGRLTDDQKPSGARLQQNGSGTERQIALTDPATANFAQFIRVSKAELCRGESRDQESRRFLALEHRFSGCPQCSSAVVPNLRHKQQAAAHDSQVEAPSRRP